MHTGHRYTLSSTLSWSRRGIILPMAWSALVTCLYTLVGWTWIAIPWLPMSLVGIAVAFYLGFKNNASYDRLWEARKIWGAIVNASRSWAFSSRDYLTPMHRPVGSDPIPEDELHALRTDLVLRHVAWMDALRHQLRKIKSWEHQGDDFDALRASMGVPEYQEDLAEILSANLKPEEVEEVLAQINPAARLLANQSRQLAALRSRGLLDGFAHAELQRMLVELMAQQGKAERIKNFPFPRQYATVNSFFAVLFAALIPFGMLKEFSAIAPLAVWATIPFSTVVSWVFLTTDLIGDWSENPFEGMPNDVPISSMARGIERDIRQMLDQDDLPDPRPLSGMIQF